MPIVSEFVAKYPASESVAFAAVRDALRHDPTASSRP
jgi:hypothetical protein